MPVRMSPTEYQEKHARRLKAALEDMRKGVERVTEAPGVKAAAAQDKMRANLIVAIDTGKWGRRVAGVSLAEWQAKMISKGIPRVAMGIDAAADKVREFATQLFDHENTVLSEIERLPDVTLEDAIVRATTWIRRMAEFERR